MSTLFVGIGTMGAPMARRYAAEFETILFDVGPAAQTLAADLGITALDSLDTIPDDVDTVLLMVPNSRIVEDVLTGSSALLSALPAGSLVIDMSSSEPGSTQMLAARAAERGIDYVDAPVSGGLAKAQSGELAIMTGGSEAARDRARPHLSPLAASVLDVGPSGSGHAAKALNNLLSATNIIAATEILTIATDFGIDPAVMTEVLNASTGRSQATEIKFPKHILTGTFDSGFGMDLMIKDLGIARELATSSGLETPLTALSFERAKLARAGIDAERPDHTEVARLYEQESGVSLGPVKH